MASAEENRQYIRNLYYQKYGVEGVRKRDQLAKVIALRRGWIPVDQEFEDLMFTNDFKEGDFE